jgi:hypothetical protein
MCRPGVRVATISRTPSVAAGVLLRDIPSVDPGAQPVSLDALDRNDDQQPRTQSWSLTLQRRLPWSVTVETGYVGSKSDRLRNDGIANINIIPTGAMLGNTGGNPNDFRPFPQYGEIRWVQHNLYSNYHSWQTLVSRQTGRFSFTGAYTFSKALGIRAGGGRTGRELDPPDQARLREFSYGTLGNDRRHLLSLAYSWLLPDVKTGITNAILGGWQLSGISQYVTGRAAPAGWRRRELPSGRHQRAGRSAESDEHHRVARSAGDASVDVRSARERRCSGASGLLRGASRRRAGYLRVAERHGTVVRQPRLFRIQELLVQR